MSVPKFGISDTSTLAEPEAGLNPWVQLSCLICESPSLAGTARELHLKLGLL